MTARLAIEHLEKNYGAVRAVRDVSIEIPAGCIFGLIGRNGAGKTTTLNCALGLMRPTSGRALFNRRVLSPEGLGEVAYVPETPSLYKWMTATEHIEMFRRSYRTFDTTLADELAEMFELPLKRRVRTLSKGQQQAVALLLAFARKPNIIVLDEPAFGLDPIMQRLLVEQMTQAACGGATIVFSSHQILQVERIAERVGIMSDGELVVAGNVDDLLADTKIVEAAFSPPPPVEALRRDARVSELSVDNNVVTMRLRRDVAAFERDIRAFAPSSVRVIDQTIEDIFVHAIGSGKAVRHVV